MNNASDYGYSIDGQLPSTETMTREQIANTLNAVLLFRNWLTDQDPDETFRFGSNGDCLIARYLKAHGCTRVMVGGYDVDADGFIDIPLNPIIGFAAKGGKNNSDIVSYGEALKALTIAQDYEAYKYTLEQFTL